MNTTIRFRAYGGPEVLKVEENAASAHADIASRARTGALVLMP